MTSDNLVRKVESALAFIDPGCSYEDWLRVGMAIRAELGDGGFSTWDGWSGTSTKYPGEHELRTKWKSFRAGLISGGTLYGMALNAGWRPAEIDVPANHVPQDREQFRQQLEADRQASETDRRARQEEAARRAAQLWALSRPATGDHPYLLAKGVAAYGIHRLGERLVVPVRDSAGKLWSLQFIGPDGQKRFLTAGRKGGCYYAIGRVGAVICVAEGYATAASIFAATGYAVAVAFDAGNLEPVARALRAKYPGQRLVICADNDVHTPGNPGIARATAAAMAVNALLAVPEFDEVSA